MVNLFNIIFGSSPSARMYWNTVLIPLAQRKYEGLRLFPGRESGETERGRKKRETEKERRDEKREDEGRDADMTEREGENKERGVEKEEGEKSDCSDVYNFIISCTNDIEYLPDARCLLYSRLCQVRYNRMMLLVLASLTV